MPVPLQSGQRLPRAASNAFRMNSERLVIPLMSFERGSSTLNVITLCDLLIRPKLCDYITA